MKSRILYLPLAMLLSLVIPTVGVSDDSNDDRRSYRDAQNPLVKLLRNSPLNYYRNSAPPDYVPDPYCTSGGNGGAMGIHFVNFSLIGDGILDAINPEVLIYEPLPGGKIRLVGAEYLTFAPAPQALNGHLLNYASAPNRYGIPDPYSQIHVWAWKRNPNGTFANWNPDVSCDAYDPYRHPQPPL